MSDTNSFPHPTSDEEYHVYPHPANSSRPSDRDDLNQRNLQRDVMTRWGVLLPPPQNEVPLFESLTPLAPTHAYHGLSSGRTPTDWHSDSETKEESIKRITSASNHLWHAGQILYQRTVKFMGKLGRSVNEGEALNVSFLPHDVDGGNPLEGTQTRRARHNVDRQYAYDIDQKSIEAPPHAEAHRLVRGMTQVQDNLRKRKPRGACHRSGDATHEDMLRNFTAKHWMNGAGNSDSGILSQLLKLQGQTECSSRSESATTDESDSETQILSSATTPKKENTLPASLLASGVATSLNEKISGYKKSAHRSSSSLANAAINLSSKSISAAADELQLSEMCYRQSRRKTRLEKETQVTVHIANIISRQRYVMRLCRALMRYGAPTHRLEEYMQMTTQVLGISGQFLYLPGCMIMSFDDPAARTAEVKLVRTAQGVDLGRLADIHSVYKHVVHNLIGVEEASQELEKIMKRKPRYKKWFIVLLYGFASAAVGPFAFNARPIDLPIIFCLGALVGLMQHVLAPCSVLYSNIFEVTAAIVTSFLARALGSIEITSNGTKDRLFCFSALAQSSIALILPGFTVLCSSLELQSHQIIAGSIRMVYAIIYSLFLGYGITVGLTIYGLMDGNASSQSTCSGMNVYSSVYLQKFPFVAIYSVFLTLVNQAEWKQVPVMVFIAVCGYVCNYFSTTKFGSQSEVANTVGAFTIGILGNLYSRLWHGHAAPAILPGIFVLVPSGLASSGSLLSGLDYANGVRHSLDTSESSTDGSITSDTPVSNMGYGMIQVAIGITVGLFMSSLVVYPFGKKRTVLFSF